MAIKGYYAAVSVGFQLLFALINLIAGTALVILGIVIMASEMMQLEGQILVGVLSIPVGLCAIAAGIMGIMGAFQESLNGVRAAYILAILTFLSAIGLGVYVYLSGTTLNESCRRTWHSLNQQQKQTIESTYGCCGYAFLADGTPGCQSTKTCNGPILADLGAKFRTMAILAAILAGIQVGAVLFECSVFSKLKERQNKMMKRSGITLAEQARGVKPSKKPKRKHGAHK